MIRLLLLENCENTWFQNSIYLSHSQPGLQSGAPSICFTSIIINLGTRSTWTKAYFPEAVFFPELPAFNPFSRYSSFIHISYASSSSWYIVAQSLSPLGIFRCSVHPIPMLMTLLAHPKLKFQDLKDPKLWRSLSNIIDVPVLYISDKYHPLNGGVP